jgi:26S proteasome regulatory subunit N2
LDKVIQDKHEDTMCKMGAIMAAGLLDAGGRNVTIGLRSRSGNNRMAAVIGMAVFTQYWYWYPLAYFVGLPLTPTVLVGLNKNLDMPSGFCVTSQAKPSTFAYAPPLSSLPTTQVG